jgi:hypothetical protein
MRVKELIELLERFDSEAPVRISVSLPGRVIAVHQNVWLGDYGGGPQINAALDFQQFHVYVGCGMEQFVTNVPPHPFDPRFHDVEHPPPVPDLGQYDDPQTASRVRDFYIYHAGLDRPLADPDFDYDHWIPPRMTSGQYNEHVAEILKEKLLEE